MRAFASGEGPSCVRRGTTMQGNAFSHRGSPTFRPVHEQTEGDDGDGHSNRREFSLGDHEIILAGIPPEDRILGIWRVEKRIRKVFAKCAWLEAKSLGGAP